MRHPPPPSEDSFNPYEWGKLLGGLIGVSESMKGERLMWKLEANLITEELQDLDSTKVQTTTWVQFKVEIECH